MRVAAMRATSATAVAASTIFVEKPARRGILHARDLHGDGRGALAAAAPCVRLLPYRAQHGARIDAGMRGEAAILQRQRRARDASGNLRSGQ